MKKLSTKIFLLILFLTSTVSAYILLSKYSTDKDNTNLKFLSQQTLETKVPIETSTKEKIPKTKAEEKIISTNEVKLLFLGDTALLEPLGARVVQNVSYNPFVHVQEKFKEYDYVVGNHEATIDGTSVGVPTAGKPYTFSIPKESVNIYRNSGIDAFSYANNHTKDYGPQSVIHTIELLNSAGIDTFGAGANSTQAFTPLIKEFKGNKIGFLAYNCAEYAFNISGINEPGTAYFNEWLVRESIKKAKELADFVIVASHCGDEHVTTPNDLQKQWANIYTSAGADFVIGGHPHVRQAPEIVNGKNVVHSVGNFLFPGQAWDPEAQIGWAVEIVIEEGGLKSYKLIESEMDLEGIPRWR